MPQEMAILLQLRARKSVERWANYDDPEHSEEVLESMRLYVEAAEAYANISAGMNTSPSRSKNSALNYFCDFISGIWTNPDVSHARRHEHKYVLCTGVTNVSTITDAGGAVAQFD
jgi:spatacsin